MKTELESRTPTVAERRIFWLLAAIYGGITLAALPWASVPGPRLPQVITVSNLTVALADVCTALLLGREFLRTGRVSMCLLACGYGFSAVMALLQLAVFPGALFDRMLFGNPQSTAWMFLLWRLGGAALLLAAVVVAPRAPLRGSGSALRRTLSLAGVLTAIGVALAALLASHLQVPAQIDGHFTLVNKAVNAMQLVFCALAVLLIWRGRAFDDALWLWLALVLVASLTDQTLAITAGGQYRIGWHVAKASAAISACLLLVFWLGRMSPEENVGPIRVIAGYGAAIGTMLAAVLMRWFLAPWLGEQYPFATLFGAVAIAVWISGWRAATLSAVCGYALAFLIFDDDGKVPPGLPDVIGAALYGLSCAIIVALGEGMRRARDRYRASEHRFRRSQEGALQGFAVLERVQHSDNSVSPLRCKYVNPAGVMLSGASPEVLAGADVAAVFPGANDNGLHAALMRVAETGDPFDIELEYETAGGARWYRHLAVKLDDGVAVSFIDTTDHKRLEATLRRRADELQRADANKSQFLAVLSHELRNPLAPLVNGIALLRHRGGPSVSTETLAMMERQMNQLRRLIDDLLDVSRIDRGKLELRREHIDLEGTIVTAIESARPAIEAKSHTLVVAYPPSPLYINGDSARLAQAISNLLNNAAKFTPEGGRIELETRVHTGHVVIAVKDNGAGIAAADQDRIFGMFVQVEPAGAHSASGLGLGLTLVRSVVEKMGGTVTAHSAGPGHGATFEIRLPRLAAPGKPSADVLPWPQRVATKRRVLVVDDNADAADSMVDVLRLSGFDARAVYDGTAALGAMRDWAPHVAFVDLNMPGVSGLEVAARARREAWGRSIRLFALTGMGFKEDVAASAAHGFEAHLTKPAAPDDVVRLAGADTAPKSSLDAASGG
jgi:signal transduction histidine kinase/CheY-like chemotaxis protein